MSKENNIVYSTDPAQNKRCEKCKQIVSECKCASLEKNLNLSKVKVVIRIEKAHRGGKEVTVIDRLPGSEAFLKDLSQKLKKSCGCGGTYKISGNEGRIEIQGDKQEQIRTNLRSLGIKF